MQIEVFRLRLGNALYLSVNSVSDEGALVPRREPTRAALRTVSPVFNAVLRRERDEESLLPPGQYLRRIALSCVLLGATDAAMACLSKLFAASGSPAETRYVTLTSGSDGFHRIAFPCRVCLLCVYFLFTLVWLFCAASESFPFILPLHVHCV
ncbi:hypothetical protein MRX96_052502 [Rhipicephalus microplus]